MQVKRVMRYAAEEQKFRLFRVMWDRGVVGDGIGYSGKLSFSIVPKLFEFSQGHNEWRLTILGVSVHRRLSYGGRFV